MIGKICRLVQVDRAVGLRSLVVYGVGLVASSAVLGLVLGAIGTLAGLNREGAFSLTLVAVVMAACGAHDLRILRLPQLALKRQTPASMQCEVGPTWGALAWGLDLGQGWTTHSEFAGFSALVISAIFQDVGTSVLLLTSYGLGRLIPAIMSIPKIHAMELGVLADRYSQRKETISNTLGLFMVFLFGFWGFLSFQVLA